MVSTSGDPIKMTFHRAEYSKLEISSFKKSKLSTGDKEYNSICKGVKVRRWQPVLEG